MPAAFPAGAVPPGGAAPKKSNTRMIVTIVVVVALVAIGAIFYVVNRKSNPANAKVGDCINYASDTNVKVVDCTASDAEYKVVKRVDGTSDSTACDGVADSDVSLFSEGGSDHYTLCVSLVVKKGDCISSDGDKVGCTDSTAAYQVSSILEGTQDESGCPAGTDQFIKHESARQVICLKSTS
jgi:hypothetical protein